MARRIDPLCLECSQLSQAEAIALHGDNRTDKTQRQCWDKNCCPRKRSHYRHRGENLMKMKLDYRVQKAGKTQVEVTENLDIPVVAPPTAFIYLFKGKAKDAPLHALGVQVVQGNNIIATIAPQRFMGLKNRQVNEYLQKVLGVLHQKYGITEFERQTIRLEPQECPVENCPLHPRTSINWS